MALDRGVWTEREAGDWEACVVTAYMMGLMWGGLRAISAPYTQAERERLERTPDESQDLGATDAMSLKVYGVKLRTLSTGTIADAVTRVGVGLCLTGAGSPSFQFQPGFIGWHEVFYVPVTASTGDLYDPLAPMFAAPQRVAAARLVAWAKGAGPNDAREVRQWEFGPPPAPAVGGNMALRPVREDFTTGTGNTTPGGQFYIDGPGAGTPKYFTSPERVQSVGETPDGSYRLLFYMGGSPQGGEYLWMPRANLTPVAGTRQPPTGYATSLPSTTPPPSTGVPPDEVAKAVAKAKAEGAVEGAAARDQAWEAKIASSHHP